MVLSPFLAITLNVIIKDPADDRILECAVEGEADYLVSGNKHLLDVNEFRGIKIVAASRDYVRVVRRVIARFNLLNGVSSSWGSIWRRTEGGAGNGKHFLRKK